MNDNYQNLINSQASVNKQKAMLNDAAGDIHKVFNNIQILLPTIKTDSEKTQLLIEEAQSLIDDASENKNKKVLIVVLTKIGLDQPNPEYFPFIKKYLSMPECVGMIGGRPGLAYYFVGFIENTLIYLDPHLVQESVHSKTKVRENLSTYSCKRHRIVDMSSIDTSVAFGFLINGYKHLKKFQSQFKDLAALPDSFLGIEDHYPYYDDISDTEDARFFDDFEEL